MIFTLEHDIDLKGYRKKSTIIFHKSIPTILVVTHINKGVGHK